jgi:predicted lipoprotein
MNRRLLNAGQSKIQNDMDVVWAAMRADTAEVIDRLQAALAEDDKAKRDDLLNRLSDDLPMLLSEMNANPETAMVLERIFADASARGITT